LLNRIKHAHGGSRNPNSRISKLESIYGGSLPSTGGVFKGSNAAKQQIFNPNLKRKAKANMRTPLPTLRGTNMEHPDVGSQLNVEVLDDSSVPDFVDSLRSEHEEVVWKNVTSVVTQLKWFVISLVIFC
jgi:hypothetical protein